MAVGVLGSLGGVLDKLLECCALAQEFRELGVGSLDLGDSVFVLTEKFFKGAATFLFEHLVDLALGDSVLVPVFDVK